MLEVAVIEEPAAAEASLDPMRSRLLAALTEPGSAAMLAARLELPRQKVNYHLKELERHGLVELAEERRKGSVTERVYRATAASYVISPSALAAVSPDPARSPDQLSARWLLALGSRLVQEVGTLLTGASRARQRVATFGIDAQVRFASAADRAAFAEELAQSVATLVSRYHDESAPGGRSHRVVVGLHQIPAAPPGAQPGTQSGAGVGTGPADPANPADPAEPVGPAAEETGTAPNRENPR
ncbi:ArsR/SmtB family transcription factor [Streptomyces sp. CBMA156]|uniref:ArsR/SmtB family transcription factor n=1 Tax=Streptomyces sp. CBMA156 TaxID=1930280 RepID=UPI001661D115|nr:helix-turn-helix domain-containing protein [Streptomyces sp. CBMA156]MBD0672523.1 transcriptional regulator [Streptomyces sp. CBMA156]